jgi:hypothetical protein
LGITTGDRTDEGLDEIAERKACIDEIFGLGPPTKKETDFHNLPPAPEDEVRSTTKSSQGPNSVGSDIVTIGAFATEGIESVIF